MVQQELEGMDKNLATQDDVRLLLVGDQGAGKTSLIYTLLNDDFDPNVPAKMANITMPAEVFPENVPLHIVDYSDREQNYEELIDAIRDANVICIVYTASEDDSLDRVANYWIPTIRKHLSDNTDDYVGSRGRIQKPIMLAANKVDLVNDEDKSLDRITSVINEFVEVEAFIEVSASTQKNVVELFSSAQKAVLYPLAPLYDPQLRVLTRKCRSALLTIFKLCDLDDDGLLSDHELNLFQLDVFGTPLQKDALDDLKSIIKQSTMDGIVDDCLTQSGFLFLHTLSIEKGLHDFTWQVLRKYNYDHQINARGDRVRSPDHTGDFGDCSCCQDVSTPTSELISDDEDIESNLSADLSWARENSSYIKVGALAGLTLATLASILALRYLVQHSARGSS